AERLLVSFDTVPTVYNLITLLFRRGEQPERPRSVGCSPSPCKRWLGCAALRSVPNFSMLLGTTEYVAVYIACKVIRQQVGKHKRSGTLAQNAIATAAVDDILSNLRLNSSP